jgi:FAD/FMN-containing dehydrogenase/Fe-S oxidoreductase
VAAASVGHVDTDRVRGAAAVRSLPPTRTANIHGPTPLDTTEMPATHLAPGDPSLERALRNALEGDVRFDAFTRGLYATDASHYQVEPLGVVFPRSTPDVQVVLELARERGIPVLPRGGGTSQCGQTVGRAIVMDCSRHLTGIGGVRRDPAAGEGPDVAAEIEVEPGVVLDHLNARLRPHGLWFPVDPSTGSRATLGGMAGNNSAGARSIRYGMMVDNVSALELVLPDGRRSWVGEGVDVAPELAGELAILRALYEREAEEIARTRPRTMRNVAGYNLDRLDPARENLAGLLVGSEGTLAFFSRLRLRLRPLPAVRALGVCHFPDLVSALDAVQHLVDLDPSAVELVDSNVLRLAAERPDFRSAMATFVRGAPGALLLVEFASTDPGADLAPALRDLEARMAQLGFPGSVVFAESAAAQAAVWSVRKAGLNIVMSMAGPRKPVSFIEDCAVPLEHLADYARRVDEIFSRHGTDGTWYAHASVGCLHVRPALNLKDPDDVSLLRRIAEETHEVVRMFGGTHSGEHGDGILRSEFLEPMLGRRMTEAFAEVKRTFDPDGIMNPGKIVDPARMDDRTLLRYPPGYADARALPVVLDWTDSNGMLGAVERCNNNGACRKYQPDVMCPSFRVTHDERHSTRGRANALRLALSGQFGQGGLAGPEMAEAMSLCVSCKGCRRECPTGVDMARMKLEWQHARNRASGIPLRERALASIPRLAPMISRASRLLNLGSGVAKRALGLAPQRPLPRWSRRPWRDTEVEAGRGDGASRSLAADATPRVALFVDTFTRWFEPENARAALNVLTAGPWGLTAVESPRGERPLCCGRTYLSAGMLDEARVEAHRLVAALAPLAEAGAWIVGLEPSCLYTLRDEVPALVPGEASTLVASRARMFEEFLDAEWAEGRPLPLRDRTGRVLVHGHCHQKAFGGAGATISMLKRVPGLEVEAIESSCCGMAGAFGYHAEHYETSMAMGELSLLPTVRSAPEQTRIVAGGTSCRAQIADGAGRKAIHPAVLLADALSSRSRAAPQ